MPNYMPRSAIRSVRPRISSFSRDGHSPADSFFMTRRPAEQAEALSGKAASYLGSSTEMTGHNAFVRINANRQMAGEAMLLEAPSHLVNFPTSLIPTS